MVSAAKVHDIEWYSDVPRSIRKHALFGLILLGVTFGGFGAWAFTAPLAAAIVAQGSFVATGQNKIVQHLEGGIIKELLVNEGDIIHEGQPLVRLDETAALANERQLFLRRARLEAIVARLNAEIEGKDKISFPPMVTEHLGDHEIIPIVESQNLHLNASNSKLRSEIALLEKNMEGLKYRSKGYREQLDAVRRQVALLEEEHEGKKTLAEQGLLRRTELKAIERAIADGDGQIGRLNAEISETESQIVKQVQEISRTEQSYRQAAFDELQGLEAELDAVREQQREAENVLRRSTIDAPVSGTIIRMHYHTAGGVIEGGKAIMEILPSHVPLIIEAQVPRTDIDNITVGQKATVRLVALNRRTTPVLHGEVFYVSADALPGATVQTTREVYIARVNLSASELARVPGFVPTPGMPAEIFVQTAERTFFNYLTKPIVDTMAKAFMEQ